MLRSRRVVCRRRSCAGCRSRVFNLQDGWHRRRYIAEDKSFAPVDGYLAGHKTSAHRHASISYPLMVMPVHGLAHVGRCPAPRWRRTGLPFPPRSGRCAFGGCATQSGINRPFKPPCPDAGDANTRPTAAAACAPAVAGAFERIAIHRCRQRSCGWKSSGWTVRIKAMSPLGETTICSCLRPKTS